MTLLAHNTTVSIFRVEVSVWDKHQAFFVEKSDGAVVFLRPFLGLRANCSASVAYQTEFVGTAPDGRYCFRLHTLDPWTPRNPSAHRALSIH